MKNVSAVFGKARHILVTGASGFIAGELISRALAETLTVSVLTRKSSALKKRFPAVHVYQDALEIAPTNDIDAIVHLSGANVFALPWTAGRKRTLYASRVGVGARVHEAMRTWQPRARVWVQASAVGFYPLQSDTPLAEDVAPGQHFAAELCQAIEAMAAKAPVDRHVSLRFGLVLGRSGGMYPTLRMANLFGMGAVVGSGNQLVAWVHIADAVGIIATAIADARIQGPLNAIAAQCNYREFAKQLSAAVKRPNFLQVPAFFLQLGLGQRAPLLLEGPELSRDKVRQHYSFQHETIADAGIALG